MKIKPPHTPKPRTLTQNDSLWLFFTFLAEELNNAGISQRKIFEATKHYDVPCTKESIHDLWIYFQKKMYGTESTTELEKIGQIDEIHEVLMKNMAEIFHIEYIPFPRQKHGDKDKDGREYIGDSNADFV